MPILKTHNDFTKTCCHMFLETKAIATREAYWCVSAQHFRWKPAWPLVRWLPTPTANQNTRLISQAKGAISSLQLPKALPEFLNVGAHTMGIWVTWKWWRRSRTGRVWNRITRARHQEPPRFQTKCFLSLQYVLPNKTTKDSWEACSFQGLSQVVPDDPSTGTCIFPIEILAAETDDDSVRA